MSENKIATEFTFAGLLRYAFPSTIMMLFISSYTIVDGLFVARFVSTDALSALNIIYPLQQIFGSVGFMVATGGSALVGAMLGQKKDREASRTFSLLTIAIVSFIIVAAIIVCIFTEPLVKLLGADDVLLPYGVAYVRIFLVFAPAQILQFIFQSFFITAGKPTLGLATTLAAGAFNIVFDYIFIVPLNLGIEGAALATGLGSCIPAIAGLIFFIKNKNGIHFSVPLPAFWPIKKACTNGSSEMVTNLSGAVTTLVFNLLMMRYAGSDGVASLTAVLYAQFVFVALFIGFSMGVAPVISYHFGAENKSYLKKIQYMCFSFIIGSSIVMFLLAFFGSNLVANAFAQKGSAVNDMISFGMRLFSFSFLFSGVNIFASSHFTALSDGKTSALISFSRTFVFILLGVVLMTSLFQMNGMWLSIPFAELMATLLVIVIYSRKKQRESK